MIEQPIDIDDFYHEFAEMPGWSHDVTKIMATKYQLTLGDAYQLITAGRERFLEARALLIHTAHGFKALETAQHLLANPGLACRLTAAQGSDLLARLQQGLATDDEWPLLQSRLTNLLTPCGCNGCEPDPKDRDCSSQNPMPRIWLDLDPDLVRSLLKSLGESGEPSTGATS